MSHFALDPKDIATSKYIVTHVFYPLQLPSKDDYSIRNNHALSRATTVAARLYSNHVGESNKQEWDSMLRMLENIQINAGSETLDRSQTASQFSSLNVGDILALHIRAQNAGAVFRKQRRVTIFEAFELSPRAKDVMSTTGKLVCSYPGSAIEVPNAVFEDKAFLHQLVNFLAHMNHDDLRTTLEQEDVANPHYITELLTGILRGVGSVAHIPRIIKRIGDDAICNDDSKSPWRRSALWLLIRITLHTSLERSSVGRHTYKAFLLFFMCCIAEEKACADLPSDVLQAMSAKISRRLQKLGDATPDWLSRIALQACTSLRIIVDSRWKRVQATQRVCPLWAPSQLDLTNDIQLSLANSGDYLRNVLADHSWTRSSGIRFNDYHPRGALEDFLSADGAFFEEAFRFGPRVTLYDVERTVEHGIDAWVDHATNNDEACVQLENLAKNYSTHALETYGDNPELRSVMLLTMFELWIALDKIAVKDIPMLAEYSPEVPPNILERLLLVRPASLRRLRRAHQYISHRHSQSKSRGSVFSSTTTTDSFYIRYYGESPRLQCLKTRIEEKAELEVCAKVDELQQMNARYAKLKTETTRALAMLMSIDVHTWPLPADQLQAQAVVFELACPVSFDMWRTATFSLLVDFQSQQKRQPSESVKCPTIKLSDYKPLESYLVKHPRSRISLGSNPPSSSSRTSKVLIPATKEEVCLQNKLTFFGFDTRTNIPVSQVLDRIDSWMDCTYELQNELYLRLQKYVNSTSHKSNKIIANQTDCHRDLSVHEYMAFAHLRSGDLLQWLNILRELRSRSLTFHRHDVHMLLAQTVSQVGPPRNEGWRWHQELEQPTFCFALLGELESLVRDIEANWLERVTMDTVSLLLRRLLASHPDQAVSHEALWLLRIVRDMTFSWVQELSHKVANEPGLSGTLWEIAAICRSTFDVDPSMIPKVLRSAEDIDVLLSCAIFIHDYMPSDVSLLPTYSKLLLDRDLRLSLSLENFVNNMVLASSGSEGINLAIARTWPNYHAGSKWTPLQAPNMRWFSCTTAPPGDQRPQVVHFNILDGSLFVDGRPIGTWLPDKFVRHPLYKQIFGERRLRVLLSDLPGMDYLSTLMISDHQVYMSLRNNDSELVIRARRRRTESGDMETMELIPASRLQGDLPAVLIEGHAHWLNHSTSVIEIRPLNNIWEESPGNWRIDCTPGRYRMQKGHEFLVDIRSKSWHMVSNLLKPLDHPENLIISVAPVNSSQPTSPLKLSVILPRYELSFYVDEDGELQSNSIRDMVYDENQFIGTLFGLVNQLVLRPKNREKNAMELIPRCVLIPDGDISFRMVDHHVHVKIAPDSSVLQRATYQIYTVNTDLGCLVGSISSTSKLYCAYLHALTSGCGDDPLTGRSGTEEALSVLQSASCWSSVRFSPRDAKFLALIASICPSWTWSSDDHSTRNVVWHNLPSSSQNHELYVLSRIIKEHHEFQLFHENPTMGLFEDFPLRDDHLLKRSARQAVYIFPMRSYRQLFGTSFDVWYRARDVSEPTSGEYRACTAATHAYWRTTMGTIDLWSIGERWTDWQSERVSRVTPPSLQYNKLWLTLDLPSFWANFYNLLQGNDEGKWFELLFSLPAMAFGSPSLSGLVPMLVAIASHQLFRFVVPPSDPSSSELEQHLKLLQMILISLYSRTAQPASTLDSPYSPQSIPSNITRALTVGQLLAWPAPTLQAQHRLLRRAATDVNTGALGPSSAPLHQLIASVGASAVDPVQHQYVAALYTSAECFSNELSLLKQEATDLPGAKTLLDYYTQCRTNYIKALHLIQQHLGPRSEREQVIEQCGLWPRITPHTLLRCLASNSPTALPDGWKKCLIQFALLALELQRSRRLVLLRFDNLDVELRGELQNEGCDGWSAETHPDWLLIQLQGNFLIRRVQAEVANEMISPRSGENTVMQLNMGEGKSSVIIPIVAAALASGDQLVRVVVPKPLTAQTLHTLADRLGGLTNRRVYYLPFSRFLNIDCHKVSSLCGIMEECMRERGILVVQPEQVLSLKLVSVEKQLSREKDNPPAHLLLHLQRWLHTHSRDLLDESDEILDVRSQLVFTIGSQQHIDGAPERWTTTQQVLGLVSKHAPSLQKLFPLGVEYEPGPSGSFPHLRIFQAEAGDMLVSWIVQDIMEGLLPNMIFEHLHSRSGLADPIRSVISRSGNATPNVQLVKDRIGQTPLWSGLLLLRGLLANGILLYAFTERRWRVDYGLAPARTMLAVPYRAKDVPAQKAEFGHPDLAIILTCLSYYYDGLSEEQLKHSFEILFRQHASSSDYDLWVQACPALPESLHTLSGINIKSAEQWNNHLVPFFSRNRATIDFYLSSVVFPREAVDFPAKLSSSGWDLAEKKERLLTGFSGTNDGQYLLPLHVSQRDPDHQRGTNAKVLSYLLQPENKHYMCMRQSDGSRLDIHEFLRVLVAQKPEIRVLLDIGAQMLNLENDELAKVWLDINPNASAAIYFNEDDELMVCIRNGSTQSLRTSPFAQQLDQCIIYLDDAHTRGTDIKFPLGFRAAVTLGPKVTKDRLVQGCMRMRKLGHGHSVMFFAPLEVDRRIRTIAGKDKDPLDAIDTMDVLHWSIREAWGSIQRWAPHWAQQGINHGSRYAAWGGFCREELSLEELSDKWLQPEAKTLEDLYQPRSSPNSPLANSPEIHQRCIDLGVQSLFSVAMEEEQEREVIHEIIREQQVVQPPIERQAPAKHSIHRDVLNFIRTGILSTQDIFLKRPDRAFSPAFTTLDTTSAIFTEAYVWSQSVLVTTDFERTVEASKLEKMDNYLRPVQWIVSAKGEFGDVLVILSPYEVNTLLSRIKASTKVHLHVYTPRIKKSMKPCDDLALHSIPCVSYKWIPPSVYMNELGVFAGQLYLKDYETSVHLCRFLNLSTWDLQEEEDMGVNLDGFIEPKNRSKILQTEIAHTFASTPLDSLRVLMALRNKGVDFSSTHMGKLIHGQLLSKGDFGG